MLITPRNITRVFIMIVCAIGVFTFVFMWVMSDYTSAQTSLYLGLTAAFALGAISPFAAGAWVGRMIMLVSFLGPVYGPAFFGWYGAPRLDQVWPAFLLGLLMSHPVYLERAVQFGLEMHRRFVR